jgi:hypothetical protein
MGRTVKSRLTADALAPVEKALPEAGATEDLDHRVNFPRR